MSTSKIMMFAVALTTGAAFARVELATPFSDYMVLQRNPGDRPHLPRSFSRPPCIFRANMPYYSRSSERMPS